jgi:phenylacetate-CoA ligase
VIPRRTLARLTGPAKRLVAGETLVRRNPLWYPRAARIFARLAAAPLEERRGFTWRRLARVLAAAARTPYGRRAGATAIDAWPLLDPATVRESPCDVVRATRFALPAATGGTTGVPLPLWRSLRSVAIEQAAIDHVLRGHGIDPSRARVAVLRGDDVKDPADRAPPYWVDVQRGRRRVFSSNHLARDTAPAFAEALGEFRADWWWVYPTSLEALVRLAGEASLGLRVPLVLSSSEVLALGVRETAARALGAVVVDTYGQAERVAFAWSDAPGVYRFLPGYAHVELLPRPDAGEGWRYEIVGTPLWNECMPLVRYRTGDLIETPAPLDEAAREALALGLLPFAGVIGRDGDILVAPDGTRLTGIDHFHRGVERIRRIQVVHESPLRVRIRVIRAPGFGDEDRASLLANARRKLPPSMQVEVEFVEALERTPHGKTPFVIRRPGVPGPGEPR